MFLLDRVREADREGQELPQREMAGEIRQPQPEEV
jgi:hypothetical protein